MPNGDNLSGGAPPPPAATRGITRTVIFFKPTAVASRVTQITPRYLKQKGIRNLIMDVDGTIAEWNTREMPPDVVR
jgi:predicted HAD superfamily phosphohydrolase YqeG